MIFNEFLGAFRGLLRFNLTNGSAGRGATTLAVIVGLLSATVIPSMDAKMYS